MLQQAADDGAHLDVLRPSAQAGGEAADAADDHLHAHARLGCLHQLFHQVLVRQGVHFQHDATGLPGPGLFDFLVDQLHQAVFQAEGRHEQVLAMLHEVAGHQAAEDLLHVGEDALVGGEEGQIRV